jgi:hypothetical protein
LYLYSGEGQGVVFNGQPTDRWPDIEHQIFSRRGRIGCADLHIDADKSSGQAHLEGLGHLLVGFDIEAT